MVLPAIAPISSASNAIPIDAEQRPAQTIGMGHDLKTIVSDNNKATFSFYRDGNFYYVVKVQGKAYSFPIPIEDARGTPFFAEFKAITLMRWIRKALENKTFQPVK